MPKRKWSLPTMAVVIAILMVSLVWTGCGQQEPEEAANPEYTSNPYTDGEDLSGTTVNIFGAFVDVDAERFEASMIPFEEATGIDIVYEGSGDFETLVRVRAEGGDPPDIAVFPQPGLMADLTRQGYIEDVSGWLGMDYLQQQYSDAWLDLSLVDDIYAGVWYRANLKSLVWYNVPVFEDEGYEIPETWDELIALSDQMVADGYFPWSITMESSGATGWVATDWVEDIMLRTAGAEAYDAWVAGDLPFNSSEVNEALDYLDEIFFNEDYVVGGTDAILTVPFGDGPNALLQDPPAALMHRQANFITGFFPEGGAEIEQGLIDYFYLPPIKEELGSPVLGAGDIYSPMADRPEVRAAIRFLSTGLSTKAWVEAGGFVAVQNDASLDWYPSQVERGYAEIILAADTFRFDASDLMPGAVGAGTFWTGMVDYINGKGANRGAILDSIDESFPQ
jgi:alpha-glucoside transport system substrate-binding protein